uniref:Uncharacterized protein n=1 Tax=Mycena chlorophos TaxID=658473 RepID=A0ABQ0M7L4_MYCCL|nr:predicted protein [Mycena chlorophos]
MMGEPVATPMNLEPPSRAVEIATSAGSLEVPVEREADAAVPVNRQPETDTRPQHWRVGTLRNVFPPENEIAVEDIGHFDCDIPTPFRNSSWVKNVPCPDNERWVVRLEARTMPFNPSLDAFLIKFPPRLTLAKDWTESQDAKIITRAFVNPRTRQTARFYVSGVIAGLEESSWGHFFHIRCDPENENLYNLFAEGVLTLKEAIENSGVESWHKTSEIAHCVPMESDEEEFFIRVRYGDSTELGTLEYDGVDSFLPARHDDPTIAIGATVRCAATMVREERLAVEYNDDSMSWAMVRVNILRGMRALTFTQGWLVDAAQVHRCYEAPATRKHSRRARSRRIESSDDEDDDPVAPACSQAGVKRQHRLISCGQSSAMPVNEDDGEDGDDESEPWKRTRAESPEY